MFHCLLRSFALCLAAVLASAAAMAQSLQLADGRVLLAAVESADGEGLRVRRLDNDGVLDLRWDHLAPTSALAVKRQYDLVGDSQDELLERAEEVEYLVNGGKLTVIGKIVEQAEKEIVVQTKGQQVRIPRSELRAVRQIDVPAGQIYTKDEFYAAKLTQFAPGDKADKHVLLVDELIKFRDYDHALEHLDKAKELGNSLDPARVERTRQKLQLYKESAKEREQLDLLRAARSRNTMVDYEKGMKLIAAYEKEYPQGKLKADFETERRSFQKGRTAFLAQQVAEQVRRTIHYVAEKKAGETISLQQARDYAEAKMTDELYARTAAQFKLELDEVKALWADRAKYPVGKRSEQFTYGIGSWILGDQGIVKGTEAGKQKAAADQKEDQNSGDVAKVARALKQALERRRTAAQGQPGQPQKEQSDEDWWQQASRDERRSWLKAYYVEFGGQLVVTSASLQPCISCFGEGSTPDVDAEGKMTRTKCFLCHGSKWLRSIKAY